MRCRRPVLSLLLACSAACYAGAPGDEDAEPVPFADEDDEDTRPADAIAAAHRGAALPGAAWLDRADSPISPWCAAVLVAPDVVVTAARCIDSPITSHLRVGFGDIATPAYAVAEIVLQDDSMDPLPDHGLAALRLAGPVHDVAPVDLALGREGMCDVSSVANRYVIRGDAGRRWLWRGCVIDDALTAEVDAPNCHGDMGAGAFTADGALLGVAVDAWSDGGCALGHRLASVEENAAFFEQAMDLSTPVG
jgi:hypothetical protein